MQACPFLCSSCWQPCFSFPAGVAGSVPHHCSPEQGQTGGMPDGCVTGTLEVTAAGGRKWGAMSMHIASGGCLWLLWMACAVRLLAEQSWVSRSQQCTWSLLLCSMETSRRAQRCSGVEIKAVLTCFVGYIGKSQTFWHGRSQRWCSGGLDRPGRFCPELHLGVSLMHWVWSKTGLHGAARWSCEAVAEHSRPHYLFRHLEPLCSFCLRFSAIKEK